MKTDVLKFTMVRKRLCPSGAWDNGAYVVSKETVEIPKALMDEAVVVRFPEGMSCVRQPVARIDLRGQSYLVIGEVK
jgi:hypothetical protein